MKKPKFTVLTPTLNREKLLHNLYESLTKQDSYDFEWIIIDDGSTDKTAQYARSIINDEAKNFTIIYAHQNNQGKHAAINHGVKLSNGKYIFIVDSDDILTPDAIKIATRWVDEIQTNPRIAGVAGLRGTSPTKKIGQFPSHIKENHCIKAKYTQRRQKHLLGDKAEIFKADILKHFPFPVFEGENFLTEESIWNQIAKAGYYMNYYNRVIYIGNYLEGGLTKTGYSNKYIKNFKGFTYATNQRIRCCGIIQGIFARGYYYEIAKARGVPLRQMKKNINSSKSSILLSALIRKIKYVNVKK